MNLDTVYDVLLVTRLCFSKPLQRITEEEKLGFH